MEAETFPPNDVPPGSSFEEILNFVIDYLSNVTSTWAPQTVEAFINFKNLPNHVLASILAITVLIILIIIYKIFTRIQSVDVPNKVRAIKEFVAPSEGPRFRKRDKIAFVMNRVKRNSIATAQFIRGGEGKKRRAIKKLVKKVFARGSPNEFHSQSPMRTVPDEFLEEESFGEEGKSIPRSLSIVFKNLRVFGHFDDKVFEELIKHITYINMKANDTLFKIGESDENLYIVDSGAVNVYSTSKDPRTNEVQSNILKKVGHGEAIFSLLSFLEYLGGRQKMYKTVSAKATEETKIIKISFTAFKDCFEKYPEDLAKVVQVVMIRLQRVTLLALHQYLGLGAELLTHTARGGNQSMTRQRSHKQPELHQLLKRHASQPESEDTSPMSAGASGIAPVMTSSMTAASPSDAANAATNYSPMILEYKNDIELMNQERLRKLARDAFCEVLNLSDEQIENYDLLEHIYINEPDEGDTLVMEDSNESPSLMIVLNGTLELSQKNCDSGVPVRIQKAHIGAVLCQLQALTNEPSFFTVTALTKEVRVARLESAIVREIMIEYPHVALRLAMSVIDNLSPYVRSIDFALEWIQLESGKALYHQNDEGDCTYVVLSGRLRSVIRHENNKKTPVAEYGRGDLTGIVETLLNTTRKTTVIAVRDTEVAKIPAGLIEAIKIRYPVVLIRLLNLLGEKLQQSWEESNDPLKSGKMVQSNTTYSTVAVISVSSNIPTTAFCMELLHPLIRLGPTVRLTKEYVADQIGPNAFENSSNFRLSEWLASQEDNHRIVLYQCDPEITVWTKLCLRHADVVFMLADPKDDNGVKPLERELEALSRRTRKEMIFLHSEDTKNPEGTSEWLKSRNWINGHYHIKCPRRMSSRKTKYTKILNSGPQPDVHSDFSRLSRYITGESVGLVLGGGGARGCSHIGMIKATLEAGIPIDHIAGVSIGAFVGGLYANERNFAELTRKARTFSSKMVQYWRQALDFTWPYASWLTGDCFNRLIHEQFEDRDILDAWLPYFTITTDITCSAMRIHDSGSFWRYVRSSMSLAGYLPPLCDPRDGHLLLDGGYTNNLPADIMKSKGAKHIIAVDVGSIDDINFTNYGDSLNGFSVLFARWFPWFCKPMNVPSQQDIQSRLAYVSCVDKLDGVKAAGKAGHCEYIRPPIDKYSTMQFGSFDEIREVGYNHGVAYYGGLRKTGQMKLFHWFNPTHKDDSKLPGVIRRGSLSTSVTNLLGSSLESNNSDVPTHIPFENRDQPSKLSDLAKMMYAVQTPLGKKGYHDDMDSNDDESFDEDQVFTDDDEDSENLISDEEDDKESGFLSQI